MTDRGWAKAVDRVRPLTTLSKPVGLLQNPRAFVQLCATGLPDEEKIDTTTWVHGVELTEEQSHAMPGAYLDGIRENEAIAFLRGRRTISCAESLPSEPERFVGQP